VRIRLQLVVNYSGHWECALNGAAAVCHKLGKGVGSYPRNLVRGAVGKPVIRESRRLVGG
jgi:hypothetical protein